MCILRAMCIEGRGNDRITNSLKETGDNSCALDKLHPPPPTVVELIV